MKINQITHFQWWKHILQICGKWKIREAANGQKFKMTGCVYCMFSKRN